MSGYTTVQRTVCCSKIISEYDAMQDFCPCCGKRKERYRILSYPEIGQWKYEKWWHWFIMKWTWVAKEDEIQTTGDTP